MNDVELKLYKGHLVQARIRNIPFKFAPEQWIAWWHAKLGTDWLKKRGRKRGQYVMARNGDKGPYAAWNVQCILATANSSEANRGRRKDKRRLAKNEVKEIFISSKPNSILAKEYSVAVGVIDRIKIRQTWAEVTEGLISPPRIKGNRGEDRWCAKLTVEDVKKMRKSNKSVSQLAKEYDLHYMTVSNMIKRKTWKHVI